MKPYLLIFLMLNTYSLLSAQLRVQDVHSDSTALQYVKQENYSKENAPQWKYFYLANGNEWSAYYNLSDADKKFIAQKYTFDKWAKADINNDGKPDLIVCGYIARRPSDWSTARFKVLLFLSQPGNAYQEQLILDEASEAYPAYFNLVNIYGRNYLQLFRWRPDLAPSARNIPLNIDTLQYHSMFNVFVNYHPTLHFAKVVKLRYKATDDFAGSYHEAVLEDDNKKRIDLTITVKTPQEQRPDVYKAKIERALWNQLDTLVNGIPKEDKRQYKKGFSDNLPAELTVYYSDSSKATFVDYGIGANYTLPNIGNVFEVIINNYFQELEDRQNAINQATQNSW